MSASLPLPSALATAHASHGKPRAARVLVLQLKRIGDFILTAPAVAALRARHPGAEIVAVVPSAMAGLARCITGLDHVLPYHPLLPNLGLWASLWFGEWDACYDFTGTDRSALMTALTRAAERHGYAKFARPGGLRARAYTRLSEASVRELHTVDFHLALAAPDAAPTAAALSTVPRSTPAFALPRAEPTSAGCADDPVPVAQLQSAGRGYAVVHIGTAREEKYWPAERWAEVIRHLRTAHGLTIVLTGTDAGLERPHLQALRQTLAERHGSTVRRASTTMVAEASASGVGEPLVLDLTGQLSLLGTARVIAGSAIALGVDSMAMHLAAMLERPQVVLFGPTNPHHWRPRQAKAVVLCGDGAGPVHEFQPHAKGKPMAGITVAEVCAAVDALV